MKLRAGFVTNSSSSSFIVSKKDLTPEQHDHIINHIEYAKLKKFDVGYTKKEDAWMIEENDNIMRLYTYMDNFDMEEFLKLIGLSETQFRWKDY